jgi:serine/threonine protein kinase
MDTYHHAADFTASNLVLAVSPTLHKLSKQNLLKLLGTPVRDAVHAATSGAKTASAPQYVVEPADLAKLGSSYLTESLRVIDFDQIFGCRKPVPRGIPPNPGFNLGTPIVSLAPEVIIEGAAGPASDIWALACTLFRMRAGMQLLGEWHHNIASNVLEDIFDDTLGSPPTKWKKLQFRDNGWPVASPRSGTDKKVTTHQFGQTSPDPDEDLKAKVYGIWDENRSRPNTPGSSRPGTPSRTGANSLPNSRTPSPSAPATKPTIFWKTNPHEVHHWGNVKGGFPHIHPDEAVQFLDLLKKMFVYDAAKRITAADILKHPWLARVKK